jgi:hypothetical protein
MKAERAVQSIDNLIAVALYKANQSVMKSELRKLRLKIAGKVHSRKVVRKALDKDIPSHVQLSEEMVAMRTNEQH